MSVSRFFASALCLGSLLIGGPLLGQSLTLDVSQATERILSNNAQLELALTQLRAAEAQIPMAKASVWDRPELRVGGINSQDIREGNGGLDVAIRSPIPRPGDSRRARVQLQGDIASAESVASATRWALEVEIRRAFQELALLNDEIALLERLAQAREDALEAWRFSLEEGATTELEMLKAELQAAEAQDDLAESLARRESLEMTLRRWAGVEGETPITPGAPPLPKVETLDGWVDLAHRTRPELRASQAAIDAAQAALAQARYENLPWIDFVQGGYDWTGSSSSGDLDPEGALTLGFAFTLPRLTPGRAGIPYAQAQVTAAEAEARSLEEIIEEEVRLAAHTLQGLKERGERLEAGTLGAAERSIRKAEQALEEGRISRQDILSFQADATELSLRRLELKVEEIEAEAELLLAIGGAIDPTPSTK